MKNKVHITCPKGLAPYLADEVRALGFPVFSESAAGVDSEGSLADTMKLNFFLRTSHRVMYLLKEFSALNADYLYKEIIKIRWEDYLHQDGYICVTSTVENPSIRDSRFANLKCKDAIVDRMNEKFGKRPDSGPERNRTVIHLYWKDTYGSIYLDTSGEPLSRRGYRKIPFKAPMQETLSAAVIIASGWDKKDHFINPMCGSGTLAIEAALYALNRPPGLLRDNFGFMHLRGFDKDRWEQMRKTARASMLKALPKKIIATDISRKAIEAAQKNADTAGVKHLIDFSVCEFRETPVPEGKGVIILNPEYGERMGEKNKLEGTYEEIGDFLKQKCRGYTGFIFTGNPELAKKVGLRPKRRLPFFNGSIECRLLEYELYEGSRRK